MNRAAVLIALATIMSTPVRAQERNAMTPDTLISNEMRQVSPALAAYAGGPIADLWERPGLSPRDRSIVTLAALITRGLADELRPQIERALDSGVKPTEISEIVTHLAFYAGWGNASAAARAAAPVFAARNIPAGDLAPPAPALLPLDQASEADRAARVSGQFANVAPGVVQYTTDVLFGNLWLRPDLAPRDRSLVTVAALVASGQVAQIPYHLNRAMDNGLSRSEAGEAFTQLAFYAGWPNVFSALPVAKDVFDKRGR